MLHINVRRLSSDGASLSCSIMSGEKSSEGHPTNLDSSGTVAYCT